MTSDLASITERLGEAVLTLDWLVDELLGDPQGVGSDITDPLVRAANTVAGCLGDLQPLAVDRSEVVDDREPEPEGYWLND